MQYRKYEDSELLTVIDDLYFGTPWEQGRLAALRGLTLGDNTETPDTVNHDEWKKGFVHGSVSNRSPETEIDNIEVIGLLPVIEMQVLPERSFWAVLNNLQIDRGLTVTQLAKRVGVSEEQLCERMMIFGFFDPDSVPMHMRVAV
ncbi:TPA: hypothetical protein ACP32N_003182 [Pseudomonas aeruginosa]